MGQRRNVFNRLDGKSGGLKGRNGAFATAAGTLDANFDFPQTVLDRLLGRLLRRGLTRERRALSAALEVRRAGGGPAQDVALHVGHGYDRVVERRLNMDDAHRYVSSRLAPLRLLLFRHFSYAPNKLISFKARYLRRESRFGPPQRLASTNDRNAEPARPPSACRSLKDYRRSLTPFLPATVFFGPLRVRAFVRVRWPRTGKERRCRRPR